MNALTSNAQWSAYQSMEMQQTASRQHMVSFLNG